ncbi:inositol monophosphatase family protein [Paracoccus shandongensis]|uniref:inositol monophosphatase family protein n=1 Tax=Paracoccus shandongensis TaxID=2816048 RepID=UPI001A8DAA75|nr:inositol monophosphatase family protein [Paracoccus shandongensis]
MQDAQDIINAAHQMADAARQAILPFFRTGLAADNKWQTGFDPVTEADRAAERAMRDVLARLRPGDAILGEEYGATEGTSGLTWILDPIDGTRAFLCGAASWGVLIGLSDGQDILYGLIDQPYTRERFEGGLGQARLVTQAGSRPLAVRDVPMSQATLMTTYPEVGSDDEGAAFRRVAAQVRLTRYGLDCYAYGLLALGQVDLVIEAGLQSYDIAGPLAVVRAAGGIVTDWQGGPAHQGGQVIAAATPALHRAALALLNGGAA